MKTPRSGFRRAAVASWTLAGIGVAGVAGASALAYADTYKPPPVAEVPAPEVIDPAPVVAPPPPPVDVPPPPPVDTPPPAPAPVVQAPVQTYTPVYTPKAPVQQQAPAQQQAPSSSSSSSSSSSGQSAFPIRKSHIPSGGSVSGGGNNFSPHVTVSRGS